MSVLSDQVITFWTSPHVPGVACEDKYFITTGRWGNSPLRGHPLACQQALWAEKLYFQFWIRSWNNYMNTNNYEHQRIKWGKHVLLEILKIYTRFWLAFWGLLTFGSFQPTESSDWCWFMVKKISTFLDRTKRSDQFDIFASNDGDSEEYILCRAKHEEMKSNIHFTHESRNLNLNFGHAHSSPREQLTEMGKNKKFNIPKLSKICESRNTYRYNTEVHKLRTPL